MNRIARRAAALLVPVALLLAGLGVFLAEYFTRGEQWALFAGSPHVYTDGKPAGVAVTDREGVFLGDFSGERRYSDSRVLRRATLHWLGDREGNIAVAYPDFYARTVTDFDPVMGLYRYGDPDPVVALTLSARVQTAALEAMEGRAGTLAVYNYRTGELLCAVTTPTFDPLDPPDIDDVTSGAYEGVYMNRLLQSTYIPGSVFKTVTLAAALDTLAGVEDQRFTCTGALELSGGRVTCMTAHGEQTLREAFTNSCNCAFGELSLALGADAFKAWVEETGVLERVCFDGFVSLESKLSLENVTDAELAWTGIGQYRDQINPCSFLTFLGVVAGGGSAKAPHVVQSILLGDRLVYQASGEEATVTLTPETARLVGEYMGRNVTEKYGAEHFPGLTVCAKSGTGEVGGGKAPNALFAGFVAEESCPLAFLAVIQEGGFGAQTCIPILAPVLETARQVVLESGN